MFVITVDQRASRSTGDKVPGLLITLKKTVPRPLVAFSRTVGDEVQGVVETPEQVIALCRTIMRNHDWYVGIGVAQLTGSLPQRSADANGPAFVLARTAVEDAKIARGTAPIAVRSEHEETAQHAQALLQLVGRIHTDRSPAAWEAIDQLMNPAGELTSLTQRDAATVLGVSPAAISKRLRNAFYDEEMAVLPLLRALLHALDQPVGE